MSSKTHYRKVYKSDHLGVADLEEFLEEGVDLNFTIKYVKSEINVAVAGRKGNYNIAYFNEPIKPLVLNVTNAEIVKSFCNGSPWVDDWKNVPVTLYADPSVKFKGEVVGGVRIRKTQPTKKEKPVFNKSQFEKAKKAGVTIEQIKKTRIVSKEVEQQFKDYVAKKTEEWYKAREGKFTASRISEILGTGRRNMTEEEMKAYKEAEPKGRRKTIDCIGEGLYTYALENAIEELYGYDPEDTYQSFDMKRGVELEPVAFEYLKTFLNEKFIEVEEVGFVAYGDHAGASSDGKTSDNMSVEIKCPKRTHFFKYVTKGASFIDPQYYDQMQMQMLAEGTVGCYFFNYYEERNKQFGHLINVDRDEDRIEFIIERLRDAIEAKMTFIEQIKKQKQF